MSGTGFVDGIDGRFTPFLTRELENVMSSARIAEVRKHNRMASPLLLVPDAARELDQVAAHHTGGFVTKVLSRELGV